MVDYSSVFFFMPFIVAMVILGALFILVFAIKNRRSGYETYHFGRYKRRNFERAGVTISQPALVKSSILAKYWPVFVSISMITISFIALAYNMGSLFFPLFITGFTLLILGTPLWAAFYHEMEIKKRQR